MNVTIGDVARRAGVSTATVSRVLAGLGGARPDTQRRVLDAAQALDYRPSDIARALKRRSTQTLGLIVTDIENPYFPQLVRSVEDAARAGGYAVLLCNAADDAERETFYLDLLVDRRVDGLIIAASSLGVRHHEWLAGVRLPVVLVNTQADGVDLPCITSDNQAGGRLAAEHLLGLGHRRFGHLTAPARNVDGPDRLAGARRALADAGLGVEPAVVVVGDPLVGGGEAAMHDLLDRAPDVTAVITYNDLMAIGAMRALRQRNYRVPHDVSLVGFDDVAFAAYVDPPLTTIAQGTVEMGAWAVDQLTRRLRSEVTEQPAPTVRLPVHLVIRESTGCPPAVLPAP
ncbi:MAG: LacI family DNA-binding transcriptional regulator [Candidatus Limnocylindrales bacterium]